MAKAVSAESFSPPVFAALCSRDLLTAVDRLARHKELIGPMRLAHWLENEELVLKIQWPQTFARRP